MTLQRVHLSHDSVHYIGGGLALVSISEVALRRARLVLGWATVSVRNL